MQDGDGYLYSILMLPIFSSRLMKFSPPGRKVISTTSFPRQLDKISAPRMRPTNAWLRSGENDRSVDAMLAHTESGTVALHSCRKTKTALVPSGDRVELKTTLRQLANCSRAYQINPNNIAVPMQIIATMAMPTRNHNGRVRRKCAISYIFLAALSGGSYCYIKPSQ